MRFLIHWILAFFIFLNPTIVLPALTDYDRQEFAFKNALADKNPGFESGSAGWTCSPSMVIDTDAADQIVPRSKGFATWDSTSAGQNCYSTAVKIPQSGNCAVGIWYKIPSGTGTHLIVANDGTNDLATESIVSSTLAQYQEVEFPCASSSTGNARIGIRSVASNEPLIAKDDAYIGRATQVRDVNINTERKAWTPTGVWVSNATYTGFESRVGDTQHVWFRISLGGAPSGTLTMNIPSGCTIDTAKTTGNNARNSLGDLLIFDSDTGAQIPGKVQGSSTTAVALNVILTGNASTAPISNITATAPITFASGDTIDGYFSVPCVGFAARTALDVADQGWFVAGEITGANPSLGTSAVTSYTEVTNGSLTLTPFTGSAPVGVACASGTASVVGTYTCGVNESLGITFNAPQSGFVEVCMAYTVSGATGNTTTFQISQTSASSSTITANGIQRTSFYDSSTTVAVGSTQRNCSPFAVTSGQNTFRLMFEMDAATNAPAIIADGNTSLGQRNFSFVVKPISGQTQAILTNSITSKNSDVTFFNSVQVGSTGTTTKETGDWVNGSCAVASAVYTCTLNSGAFTTDPSCRATVFGETTNYNAVVTSASTSTVVVRTFDTANTAAAAAFSLDCSSPR